MKFFCSTIRSLFFIYYLNVFVVIFGDRCCQIGNRESPMYKLLKRDSRSMESVISRKEVTSLNKCKKFAVSKKSLAFNYRETSMQNYRRRQNVDNSNCQALECPEIDGLKGLTNDTRFSYYSIYRSRIPTGSTSECNNRGKLYFWVCDIFTVNVCSKWYDKVFATRWIILRFGATAELYGCSGVV